MLLYWHKYMTTILQYSPGQTATIWQEIKDANGVRTNDGYVPVITRIIVPEFTLMAGYPQGMTQFDIGLYYFQFTLPVGAASIGSYLVDIIYLNPINGFLNTNTYQIIVNALS